MAKLVQIRISSRDFERAAQYPEAWRGYTLIGQSSRMAPSARREERKSILQRIKAIFSGRKH